MRYKIQHNLWVDGRWQEHPASITAVECSDGMEDLLIELVGLIPANLPMPKDWGYEERVGGALSWKIVTDGTDGLITWHWLTADEIGEDDQASERDLESGELRPAYQIRAIACPAPVAIPLQ